jgi:GntR family transcriptional regulator of arabinose operon
LERQFQYQEIARELRQRINRGVFRVDERLPSERALSQSFGVQRNTIRQALSLLEDEGRIITEGKRGSFVRCLGRHGSGQTLHLFLHVDGSPSTSRLLEGFDRVATQAGFVPRHTNTHPEHGRAFDPVPKVEDLRDDTAGIALWPQNPTHAVAISRLAAAAPLVLIDRRVPGVSSDCVRFNDVEGGRMVTELLVRKGHRRVAFLTDDPFAETVQLRWQGYAMAQEAAGLPIDPRLSLFFNGIDRTYLGMSLRFLLGLGDERPTAVVCSNDLVAFTLMRFLQDEGIRVPADLAVTGYGNIMPDYTEAMGLTSVDQAFDELGQAAAQILVERGREGRSRDAVPQDLQIPVSLVERTSSG